MKGIVYVALYIDNNLMIGDKTAIIDAMALKNKGLVLKVVEGLQDYLSCEIKFSENKKHAWLHQPHLIKNLKSKFEKLIEDVWSNKTPSTPKFLIVRPTEDYKKVLVEDQWIYQSGVGMLLYLMKHSRPNIADVTRELSKANNEVNPAAYKELLHVIKYVIETENLGLRLEPTGNSNKPWEIICFNNNDYVGDPVSRQSISGFILYVFGIPVSWWSKSQKSVSLSSSKVEYITLSEAVKEVMFDAQLLESMQIVFKYPVMVRIDNEVAIFMASNITTTSHTKHVDIWYKYVNEYIEKGLST